MNRLFALGADGDKNGWVTACQYEDGSTSLEAFGTVGDLWSWRADQPGGHDACVLIDVPIGLMPLTGYRPCDSDAIGLLGERRWSVFLAPGRYLLDACEEGLTSKELFGRVQALEEDRRQESDNPLLVKGMSQQALGILPRVRELDDFMAADTSRHELLAECHPEVSFLRMSDGQGLASKTSARGQLARLDLVRAAFPGAEQVIRAWEQGTKRSLLDILDAYAALWSALRWRTGVAEELGDGVPDVVTGAPLRMVA